MEYRPPQANPEIDMDRFSAPDELNVRRAQGAAWNHVKRALTLIEHIPAPRRGELQDIADALEKFVCHKRSLKIF